MLRTWINLLVILSAVFELTACGGIARPKGDICIVDAPRARSICYDMEKDFDDESKLKVEAKQHDKPLSTIADVDKFVVFDPDSWAEIKAFKQAVTERLKECESK